MFREWQEARRSKEAEREYEAQLAEWQEGRDEVADLLEAAETLPEVDRELRELSRFRTQKDETLVSVIEGAGIVEPRASGRYRGESRGVSIRITKGFSYRMGSSRGSYEVEPDKARLIDAGGKVYITSQRVVYTSPIRNQEWPWAKLVEMHDEPVWFPQTGTVFATYLAVSNRQRTSGIVYPQDVADIIQGRLGLALAVYEGSLDDFQKGVREALREIDRQKPQRALD